MNNTRVSCFEVEHPQMKMCFKILIALFFLFSFLGPNEIGAQSLEQVVQRYHKNILGSINLEEIKSIKSIRFINYESQIKTSKSQMSCTYSNQGMDCVEKNLLNDDEVKLPGILPARISSDEIIDFALNLIVNYEDSSRFSIEYANDSITVFKEIVKPTVTKFYSIDNKQSILIQTKNLTTTDEVKYESETNYFNYRRFQGILYPTETRIVSSWFTSSSTLASIEFEF